MQDIPKIVLEAYDLGPIDRVTKVSDGLIHQTYKVESMAGDFILQRLHPLLGTSEIGQDFFAVTTHLNNEGFPAPEAVLGMGGEVLVNDGEYNWRMQTYIDGRTYSKLDNPYVAKEAGAIYGRLHKSLASMDYEFQSELKLHETEKIFAEFQEVIGNWGGDIGLKESVRDEVDFILEHLPKQFLPSGLPQRVIHGDPKISNILFKGGEAVGVIDLDTCNNHTVLVDVGDAFRSWCGRDEDDSQNAFNLELFEAGWLGYIGTAGDFLTDEERSLVPRAISCITLELAARFLKDVFDDSYFGWDAERYASRREHNLARVRGQIALYKDLQDKLGDVNRIVQR
ncbi:phosphotransferase [Candidatus Uhrbacteria bacterium]|jgi:Ser/Thr protein kinase RdoA (MazF antagonist)|nr:phosphotransferase [Candidatus Uhrbacteria bacterium]